MKILHINGADVGSTGKIVADISAYAFACGHQSVLCTPTIQDESDTCVKKYATSLPGEQGIYRRLSYLSGIAYGFAPISTCRIIGCIRKEKPDIVHIHSINGAMVNIYRLLAFLKKKRIPTVVTNHAEFFYTGNCSYSEECEQWEKGCSKCPMLKKATGSLLFDATHIAWNKMQRAFIGFDKKKIRIVSVSPWVGDRSKRSGILRNYEHETVLNGVNTRVFSRLPAPLGCSETGTGVEKILLHVTSNFSDRDGDIKGGKYILQLAERLKGQHVRIVVAGAYCVEQEVPANVTLLGRLANQKELADWYRRANLTVLTSKRETFGMAVAESLCCGTPVVGFRSGGSESVAIPDHTEFVEFSDLDSLEAAVSRWIDYKTEAQVGMIEQQAKEKYDADNMSRAYLAVYDELLK